MVKRENVLVKFIENIENDQVKQANYDQDPITVLHYAAKRLYELEADPKLVKAMNDLTAYIDERFKLAFEQGGMDFFSYSYLSDQGPIKNSMIHVTHPFFISAPYFRQYKVAEFYPRDNMDQIYKDMGFPEYGGISPALPVPAEKNFSTASVAQRVSNAPVAVSLRTPKAISTIVPGKISPVAPATLPALTTPQVAPAAITPAENLYMNTPPQPNRFWMTGPLLPLLLFALFGLGNKTIGL
jgi:hypothetical protein